MIKEDENGKITKEILIDIFDFTHSSFEDKSYWMRKLENPYESKDTIFYFELFDKYEEWR